MTRELRAVETLATLVPTGRVEDSMVFEIQLPVRKGARLS